MSATAVRFMLFPAIVKSVPSPSIFSASLPKVKPMFAGMFTSAPAVRLMSPVPAVSIVKSAFDPFVTISFTDKSVTNGPLRTGAVNVLFVSVSVAVAWSSTYFLFATSPSLLGAAVASPYNGVS